MRYFSVTALPKSPPIQIGGGAGAACSQPKSVSCETICKIKQKRSKQNRKKRSKKPQPSRYKLVTKINKPKTKPAQGKVIKRRAPRKSSKKQKRSTQPTLKGIFS